LKNLPEKSNTTPDDFKRLTLGSKIDFPVKPIYRNIKKSNTTRVLSEDKVKWNSSPKIVRNLNPSKRANAKKTNKTLNVRTKSYGNLNNFSASNFENDYLQKINSELIFGKNVNAKSPDY